MVVPLFSKRSTVSPWLGEYWPRGQVLNLDRPVVPNQCVVGLAAEPPHVAPPGDRPQTVQLRGVHPAVVLPIGRIERDRGHLILDGIEDVAELAISLVEARGGRRGVEPPQELREPLGLRRVLPLGHRSPSLDSSRLPSLLLECNSQSS